MRKNNFKILYTLEIVAISLVYVTYYLCYKENNRAKMELLVINQHHQTETKYLT